MRRPTLLFLMALLTAFVLLGCAGTRTARRETVVTETTVADQRTQGNEGYLVRESDEAKGEDTTKVVTKTTEVKEERVTPEERGILGTTIHVIGQVIALPFRIVAGLIGIIF